MRTGVQAARGDRILFADADGATPIEEERRLSAALAAGADLAVGSRLIADSQVVRHRTWGRAVVGRAVCRRGAAHVLACPYAIRSADSRCSVAGPLRRLFALSQENGYLFDIEILALAQQLGYRIAEVPINWADRPGSRLNLWKDAGRSSPGCSASGVASRGCALDYDSTRPH